MQKREFPLDLAIVMRDASKTPPSRPVCSSNERESSARKLTKRFFISVKFKEFKFDAVPQKSQDFYVFPLYRIYCVIRLRRIKQFSILHERRKRERERERGRGTPSQLSGTFDVHERAVKLAAGSLRAVLPD